MRRGAKAVNFGVIYGQSPFGLAKQLGIEQAEAAQFIDAYFDRYRGRRGISDRRYWKSACETGYVSTILGRRRAIRGIRRGAARQRNLPERTAINTVIQGSAADLIKLAMINIHRRLAAGKTCRRRCCCKFTTNWSSKSPPTSSITLAQLVADEMSGVMKLNVPLKVDLKSGDNWADCQEWN